MSAPKKYDQEFRDRADRVYRDRLGREGTPPMRSPSRPPSDQLPGPKGLGTAVPGCGSSVATLGAGVC